MGHASEVNARSMAALQRDTGANEVSAWDNNLYPPLGFVLISSALLRPTIKTCIKQHDARKEMEGRSQTLPPDLSLAVCVT